MSLYLTKEEHLLYEHEDLSFRDDCPIKEVIFRYSNENNIKMYWVDGTNLLRHINIMDPPESTVDPTMLEVVSECSMENIAEVEEVVGGYYTSGRLQYAYQLFDLDGSESLISPCSPLYSIFPNFEGSTSREARGGKPEENCNKSFRVTINDLDIKFKSIRLIAIHYSEAFSEPSIRIVHEADFKDDSITLLDTGAVTLGEYSQAMFRTLNNRTVIPNTITTKDNRLILGNVREEYFDVDEYIENLPGSNSDYWDARAYRWITFGGKSYYKINGTIYKIEEDITPNQLLLLEDIPQDDDCVWNDDSYIYQKDGTTLGGEGINIKYEFIEKDILIDDYSHATTDYDLMHHSVELNETFSNQYGSTKKFESTGYQPLETYRFGIVFIDDLGRSSFVKWISDIKFPEKDLAYRASDKTHANILGIKFTVENIPNDLKYFIVRVPRNEEDKSILGHGILAHINKFGTVNVTTRPVTDAAACKHGTYLDDHATQIPLNGWNDGTVESGAFLFYSPEVSFNRNIKIPNNSKLLISHFTNNFDSIEPVSVVSTFKISKILNALSPENVSYWDDYIKEFNIIDNIVTTSNPSIEYSYKADIGSGNTTTRILKLGFDRTKFTDGAVYRLSGTSLLLSIEGDLKFTGASANFLSEIENRGLMCYIFIDKSGKQYGGNLFSNRAINRYIKCSSINKKTDSEVNVYDGDTFTQFFSCLFSTSDGATGGNSWKPNKVLHFPVETTYDLYNRTDLHPNSQFFQNIRMPNQGDNGVHETVSQGVEFVGEAYPDYLTDLYTYNKAYSREADAQIFYPKPYYARFEKNFGNRIMISDKYLGIELSDPWLKFPFDQQTDVDSNHGQINKLINFRDNILFFQDKAFGVIPINERRVMSPESQEQSELTIGRGDLISDYKYLSERSGCQSPYAAIKTNAGVYWLDMINRKFNLWSDQGLQSLSDKLGVNKIFSNYFFDDVDYLKKLLEGKGVQLVYNSKKNLILMSLSRMGSGETINLSYNEKIGVFQSRYIFTPSILLDIGNTTMVIPINKTEGHSMFKGEYGNLFNTSYKPITQITKIANDNPFVKKTFNNLEFNSIVRDGTTKGDVGDQTFNKLKVSNSYQISSVIGTTLVPGDNLIRRSRTWRTTMPRSFDGARMIDYYLQIELRYEDTSTNDIENKQIILDDLIVSYAIPSL